MNPKDRVQMIVERFAEAAAEEPDLSGYYELHQELFHLMNDTKRSITAKLELADQEALETRLRHGLPLLSFAQLPVASEPFANLATVATEMLVHYQPDLEWGTPPPDVSGWFALAADRFHAGQARENHQNSKATPSLVQLATDMALKPYLAWAAEQVLPHVDLALWKRQYCPVCGGAPDLALLTEDSGARQLVCSRCNTQWPYSRTGCAYCDTTDYNKSSYYPSDDGVYRLYVCDACQRYLKTVDLRQTRRPILVEVERVTTVDLDLIARDEGYL